MFSPFFFISIKMSSKKAEKPPKGILSKLGIRSLPNSPASSTTSLNELNYTTAEKQLVKDILEIRSALNYFLNSDIKEAENILKPRYQESMYHALGYSFILYLKCVMTFEEDDIQYALEVLKHTIQLSGNLRKKDNNWIHSVTSWVKGTTLDDIKNMTLIERHAVCISSLERERETERQKLMLYIL